MTLHWDASYKEPGVLCQHHGKSQFRALITGTNELGEIRVQFHVVTDSHDQMERALASMCETTRAYGQQLPTLVFTDNVVGDKAFFEAYFNLHTDAPHGGAGVEEDESGLPVAVISEEVISVLQTATTLNTKVDAMRFVVRAEEAPVISIDAEWDVHKDSRGYVRGCGSVAVIQLAFLEPETKKPMVLLLQLYGRKALPRSLELLFGDPAFTFVGRAVGADLARIGKDFNCVQLMRGVRRTDLGPFARARGAAATGNVSLEELCKDVLKQRLLKHASVRQSLWSKAVLSKDQIQYAALDASVGLIIFLQLRGMPDLTARIGASEAVPGVVVDVVPGTGSAVGVMATCAGWGKVVQTEGEPWETPVGCEPVQFKITASNRLVEVDTLTAPLLLVPRLKRLGKPVTLGDLKAAATARGEDTFKVVLPLRMLAKHLEGRVRPAPTGAGGGGAEDGAISGVQSESGVGGGEDKEPVWVECADCEKWRELPLGKECLGEGVFRCNLLEHSSCEQPQEPFPSQVSPAPCAGPPDPPSARLPTAVGLLNL